MGESYQLVEPVIPSPTIPRVIMTDLKQAKMKFNQDIAGAEHHIDRVAGTNSMSTHLFRSF